MFLICERKRGIDVLIRLFDNSAFLQKILWMAASDVRIDVTAQEQMP